LFHEARIVFHESVVVCSCGQAAQPDSPGIADPGRVADPGRFTNPAAHNGAGGLSPNGGPQMTPTQEPVAGYDSLKTKEVVSSLTSHSQVELAKIDVYEQANEGREPVFNKLRWLRQDEPMPGYDALSPDEVVAALASAKVARLKDVRGYERKFKARREILEEVDKLHRERRTPLVSRDSGH
jgi:hypothetical protein